MEALCAFLLIACYFDYRFRRIPNGLLGIMLVSGLSRSFLWEEWRGCLHFLLCMLLLVALLYPLFKLGALGAGDVKLFGVCSGFFPYDRVLYFLFSSLLIAAIFSVLKIMIEKNARERFTYMGEYFIDVVTAGRWQLYVDNARDCYKTTIPLAGPVLVSVLLHMGGVY